MNNTFHGRLFTIACKTIDFYAAEQLFTLVVSCGAVGAVGAVGGGGLAEVCGAVVVVISQNLRDWLDPY